MSFPDEASKLLEMGLPVDTVAAKKPSEVNDKTSAQSTTKKKALSILASGYFCLFLITYHFLATHSKNPPYSSFSDHMKLLLALTALFVLVPFLIYGFYLRIWEALFADSRTQYEAIIALAIFVVLVSYTPSISQAFYSFFESRQTHHFHISWEASIKHACSQEYEGGGEWPEMWLENMSTTCVDEYQENPGSPLSEWCKNIFENAPRTGSFQEWCAVAYPQVESSCGVSNNTSGHGDTMTS